MGILRLLLALSVVVAHTSPLLGFDMIGGQLAVKSFYIISGFYMSLILNEKYIGKNKSYRLFISNRFLRLYPVYWTVLILSIILCFVIGYESGQFPIFDQFVKNKNGISAILLTAFANLFIFGQDLLMFMGISPEDGSLFFTSNFSLLSPQLFRYLFIPQAWTLSLELMFYLIAPFILNKGFKMVIPLILISLGIRLYIHYYIGYQDDPWSYRFFPSELMFFLFGYLSYRFYLELNKREIHRWISILSLIYIICLTLCYSSIHTFGYPLILKDILYFGSFVFLLPFIFILFKSIKIDTSIGELSYPVYISHVFMILLFGFFNPDLAKNGLIVSVSTIAFSILLVVFISNPIERIRQARIKK